MMKTYEPGPGEDINDTARKMVTMAQHFGEIVTAEFNEIPLDAMPTSKPEDIAAGYMAELQRRSDEYHASPEYAKRQQEAVEAHARKVQEQGIALAAAPATLTLRDSEGWQKAVEANKSDPYSNAVMVFAAKWARIMEGRMAAGATLAECADAACSLADDDGITGFMYGAAVSTLAQVWIHGKELRRWHNRQYMTDEKAKLADESGGTVNPAILTIG
jgi:hypothetical protein